MRLPVLDQRAERVAREPLETAIDAGHAQHRILDARGLVEEGVLGELAERAADVVDQLLVDLDVARLVPALARHVHLEFPGRVGEVPERAARGLERLQLADEDAVELRAQLERRALGALGGAGRGGEEHEARAEIVEHRLERGPLDALAQLRPDLLQHAHDARDVVGQGAEQLVLRVGALEAQVAREVAGGEEPFHGSLRARRERRQGWTPRRRNLNRPWRPCKPIGPDPGHDGQKGDSP